MKLQFVGVKDREGDVREFIFKPARPLSWQAGQYLHYTLPHPHTDDRGVERWFTISSAPSEGEIRITTRINPEHGSSFKQALQALQPGDEIEADGPEGDFTLGDLSTHYIFIVGGIGITPVRSMLVEADTKGLQPHATVLYANRTNEVAFREELDALQAKNPNLTIRYVIEPERLNNNMFREVIDDKADQLFYVSGPEPMVKAFFEQLQTLGVRKDKLKTDDFPGYEGI